MVVSAPAWVSTFFPNRFGPDFHCTAAHCTGRHYGYRFASVFCDLVTYNERDAKMWHPRDYNDEIFVLSEPTKVEGCGKGS